MKFLKKFSDILFSTSAAGFYITVFALAIAAATFIENDFGTSAAQKIIFRSRWFELILILFGISLVANVIRFRMLQQKKWAILTFHLAMIIILIGAGMTRFFGSEGMMHIRENSTADSFLSRESYLQFEAIHNERRFTFDEPVLFASLGNNRLKKSYLLGQMELKVEVLDFVPNPTERMVEASNGVPIIKVVIGGMNGREEYFVKHGDKVNIHGTLFNFGGQEDIRAFNIKYENGKLTFMAGATFTQMQMATQQRDTLLPGIYHPLLFRSLYSNGSQSFVFGDFKSNGQIVTGSSSDKMSSTSVGGLNLKVSLGNEERLLTVYGAQGVEGRPQTIRIGDSQIAISYGAKRVQLPFSIQLHDFILERYSGTNSASSYASEVTLRDPRKNLVKDHRIYMNHILNYDGYRFFQSSFDQDEQGTYLSVNHDAWGTRITYLGYILLTLGMVLTFFSRNSRFRQLGRNIKKMRQASKAAITLLAVAFLTTINPLSASTPFFASLESVHPAHASEFGKILVQDYQGRIKPMNTFANEILRKLSRKEKWNGQSAEQIILSMSAFPRDWYSVPVIKLGKSEEIRQILKTNQEYVAYSTCFGPQGEYLLRDYVRKAYNTPQRDRGTFDKELLKLDEKVNICGMIFSGRFMSVFPIPGDTEKHWLSPADVPPRHVGAGEGTFVEEFYPAYISTLQTAIKNDNWDVANRLVAELGQYQQNTGRENLPSGSKIKAELLLNHLQVFSRLGKWYGLLSLAFLTMLFISVFNPNLLLKWPAKIGVSLLVLCFVMHTFGLGLRWYVSGRAPWSNGYESMIYIGWTTILAGLIFARKTFGGLAATTVLASTILMVAGLSFMDPEITPLVPVLKSYWLTIHVSLEAGSYGFLMLGAIIGILNLIFMTVKTRKNKKYVNRVIKEMTAISEMTLIGGLFMISIGTYLGGVWANESWGRYWGWDAKETWALVTILVYSFILHMRFIPGLRGAYAFNVATLFGLATVLMTYFGVNYYLSGLHSYAAGDPVPIPSFVYYTGISLLTLSLLAYWRNRKLNKGQASV